MSKQQLDEWFVTQVLPLEPMLSRFLRRNWHNKADLPDLLQEVYTRVYVAAEKSPPLQVKPFLFMVARNLMIDWVRRGHVIPIEKISDLETAAIPHGEASPERVVSGRQELRLLQDAMNALPGRIREAVVLRRIEGLSQKDAAARMGVTEAAIERHIARGMQRLADNLFGTGIFTGRPAPQNFSLRRDRHD